MKHRLGYYEAVDKTPDPFKMKQTQRMWLATGARQTAYLRA